MHAAATSTTAMTGEATSRQAQPGEPSAAAAVAGGVSHRPRPVGSRRAAPSAAPWRSNGLVDPLAQLARRRPRRCWDHRRRRSPTRARGSLPSRQHLARAAHEELQQRELPRRERHFVATAPDRCAAGSSRRSPTTSSVGRAPPPRRSSARSRATRTAYEKGLPRKSSAPPSSARASSSGCVLGREHEDGRPVAAARGARCTAPARSSRAASRRARGRRRRSPRPASARPRR